MMEDVTSFVLSKRGGEMEAEEGNNKGRTSCSLGEEVRRIHIIYFLSRVGRMEHPHLISVHHLPQNGVHLQDVKRWLSELRGKDMPDSFAWSYKRKYKMGYVWQDILDEDLITPISENEYVLKGSDISAIASSSFEPCLCGGKKPSTPEPKENYDNNKEDQEAKIIPNDEDSVGPLDYSETSTSSSGTTTTTTTTDESAIFSIKSDSFITNPEVHQVIGVLQENENSIQTEELEGIEDSLEKKKGKEKNKKGGGATNVLRSFLNCRTIDTDDSATMMINNHMNKNNEDANRCTTEIGKMESFGGGSERIFGGTCWNIQTQPHQHYNRRSCTQEKSMKVSDAFKPVSEPHCSQCGKGFKPEKLHSHMKSCRGMKSSSKNHGCIAVAGCYDVAAAVGTKKKDNPYSFKETNMNYSFPTK